MIGTTVSRTKATPPSMSLAAVDCTMRAYMRAPLSTSRRYSSKPSSGRSLTCVVRLPLLFERLGAFLGVGGAEDRQADLHLDLERFGLRQAFGRLHRSLHSLYGEGAVARDACRDLER